MLRWLTGLTTTDPARKAGPGRKKGPAWSTDRQRPQRITHYFDCTWMSQWGEQQARVSTLSASGCYIESRTAPMVGTELREITVTLLTGAITVRGAVVESTPGIGFAVRFIDLGNDAQAALNDAVRATCAAGGTLTPSSAQPPVP
jgi:hypothetical protein